MSQHRRGRGGPAARRSGPMGVVLAFAAAAALFVGATSVPAVGDEAELVDAPVISDTEIINDTPAAGDRRHPGRRRRHAYPIVVDDITEDDISRG